MKCECDEQAAVPLLAGWYSDEEKAAWGHAPGKCPCTADLKQYYRDGKLMWLCSACCLSSDTPVAAPHQMAYHEILRN